MMMMMMMMMMMIGVMVWRTLSMCMLGRVAAPLFVELGVLQPLQIYSMYVSKRCNSQPSDIAYKKWSAVLSEYGGCSASNVLRFIKIK
jgi:hypothetical protein